MNPPKDSVLFTPASDTPWNTPSRFKEHLSLAVAPPDHEQPLEQSRFSPDSPAHAHPVPPTPPSNSSGAFSLPPMYRFSPRSNARDVKSPSIRDRVTRFFFDARAPGRREPELGIPIQEPWPPLHIEKRTQGQGQSHHACCTCTCRRHQDTPLRKWRRRVRLGALLLFLLYLLINLIVLNTRVFAQPQLGAQTDAKTMAAPQSSSGSTLSADTQQCLAQYTLNAPAAPTTYPCATCLPLVAAVPANAASDSATARDATQFCALRALWEDAGPGGQSAFENAGWVKDVRFCAWGGVQCDGAGKVSSLALTFPAVPASIPSEFGNLTDLASFRVIGNNASPAGPLPASFASLTGLLSLHIESTSLSGLPNALPHLASLTLVRNAQIGAQLPPSLGQLQSLIVNNETLSLSAAQQDALCSRKLQTCDLRGTGVQACGSCLVG